MPRHRPSPAAPVSRARRRVSARAGYDLWAATYDGTPNPVVAMDARHTLALLAPQAGERVLDAACGTGRHLGSLAAHGCVAVGVDLSLAMLGVARARWPDARVVAADLAAPLPLRRDTFDAVLCALVGEHLDALPPVFVELRNALRPGGRLVFSVYHPALAAAGIEANFVRNGVEYRLGARLHSARDYEDAIRAAGLAVSARREFHGDEALAAAFPAARKFIGVPVLLVFAARRTA